MVKRGRGYQAVIFAGGRGTRLRPITETVPKALVPVCGRPFMEYQLEFLANSGIEEVVVCLGHLGHMIEQHFGDGAPFGVRIRYAHERDRLLGTAGAVKNAEDVLRDVFFVVNGDTYPLVDFQKVMQHFLRHDRLGLMVVFRNQNRWDRSNVALDFPFVRAYDKVRVLPGMVYIDFGVSVLRRAAFALVPTDTQTDMAVVYQSLIARRQLLAFETFQRFCEVGSHRGLQEFQALVEAGALPVLERAQRTPRVSRDR